MDEEYQNWFNSLSPEQQAGATKFSGGGGSGMGNIHSQQITQGNFDAMINPSLEGTTLTKSPPAPVMNNTTPAVDNFDMTKQMQLPQLMGPAGQPFQKQVDPSTGMVNPVAPPVEPKGTATEMTDMSGNVNQTTEVSKMAEGIMGGELPGASTGEANPYLAVGQEVANVMDIGSTTGDGNNSTMFSAANRQDVQGTGEILLGGVKSAADVGQATGNPYAAGAAFLVSAGAGMIEKKSAIRKNEKIDYQTDFENQRADNTYSVYSDPRSVYYRGEKGYYG